MDLWPDNRSVTSPSPFDTRTRSWNNYFFFLPRRIPGPICRRNAFNRLPTSDLSFAEHTDPGYRRVSISASADLSKRKMREKATEKKKREEKRRKEGLASSARRGRTGIVIARRATRFDCFLQNFRACCGRIHVPAFPFLFHPAVLRSLQPWLRRDRSSRR